MLARALKTYSGTIATPLPLGEILLKHKLITHTQLHHALNLQERSGSRLGDILIAENIIGYYALYHAVAEYHHLAFVNLLIEAPDPSLLRATDADIYLRQRIIPWRKKNGQVCVAMCDLSQEDMDFAKEKFGTNLHFVITSPFDISRTVERYFGKNIEKSSRLTLWRKNPQASARTTMSTHQQYSLYGFFTTLLLFFMLSPIRSALALLMFCHITYAITMLFKYWVFVCGTSADPPIHWKEKLAALKPYDLPIYTVLIPMYKEASSLPGMLEAMKNMDYPASKLDIKLVLEVDDHETLDAAYALKPSYQFDIIRVPQGDNRTKPKACNDALRFARGEFLTIFDADDRPDKWQIKKAVYMFRTLPTDVVCLQARLNYYNTNDNLLTRFFSLEYTVLFDFMLRGLERTGIPIPLGGTSNHMALKRIRELGEWDPYNVTEDADLGARLAARGFRTAMLDSFTLEEAPNSIGPWVKQRSRWIKGYMQTWLVHMRSPVTLYKTLGWKSFTGFQFFVGLSSFTFLTAPLVWLSSLLWMSDIPHLYGVAFPKWLVVLTLSNLALNLLTHWYFTLYCAQSYRKHTAPIITAALLYPLYLVLHSIASYKALWQLIFRPHFWEKTEHGLAKNMDMEVVEA